MMFPKNDLRNISRTVLILVSISLTTVILYWWSAAQRSHNTDIQKLTIAQAGDFFLYAPLYIAKDAGFFASQGLDVSIVSTGGDDKTWAAVISGGASFGMADPTFVAVSETRGLPGRVVASIVNGVPFWGITLDSNLVITEPEDLSGLTVGTFPSPSTAYTLQKKMFLDGGLAPNIRQGAFGTLLAMLRARQVDIALELEPNVSQAIAAGATIVYSLKDIYGDFAITGLTTTPELVEENPELVRKVVCGVQLALEFIRSNPDSTLELLLRRFPEIDRSIAELALARVISEGIVPRNAIISEVAWGKAINLRIEVGDIEKAMKMEEYVDNSFAKWAEVNCRVE
ncbi:MAG: ABC transporter substrate-binding protein [Candidatus Marinimicrobia bacterium]|nr:ABC transporter substrate-binding protein [Candidatus Neomarinimicrobiota bacterium]